MNNEVKKAIGVFFISLFTLGLANIIYVYILSERALLDVDGKMIFPMREAVLYVITFGFYGFFWANKLGKRIDNLEGVSAPSSQTKLGIILALPFLRSFCVAYIYARLEGTKELSA